MSAQPIYVSPPLPGIPIEASSPTLSFWDRITTWASENKAVVYIIAGVAVVGTGAGVIYYYGDSSRIQDSATKRTSKKERRKVKKEKEAAEKDLISGRLS